VESARSLVESVLGGDGAPSGPTGVVLVTNAQSGVTCSGTLIAPTLVLTALHCVSSAAAGGDEILPAGGFTVGFGPRQDTVVARSVDAVLVPDVVDAGMRFIDAARAAGEDVAVLHLGEPAPSGESIHDVDLTFSPVDQQPVTLVGYGIADLSTGASGTRGAATGTISGFDAASGIIETSGAQACYGDSGGPVLGADGQSVLGVITDVGSGDAGACSSGLTFANTAANPVIRRFLAKACADVGGCGPAVQSTDAGPVPDATAADGDSGGGDADRTEQACLPGSACGDGGADGSPLPDGAGGSAEGATQETGADGARRAEVTATGASCTMGAPAGADDLRCCAIACAAVALITRRRRTRASER
jgi:hypothetical protein